MPTTRTVTVKGSGGDYTTLAAAITAESKDLVSLDRVLEIELYASAGALGVTDIAGFTTDATRYLHVTVPSAERHNGAWSASQARFVASPGYNLPVVKIDTAQHVVLDGVQIENGTGLSNAPVGLELYGTGGGVVDVVRPIIRCTGSTSGTDGGAAIAMSFSNAATIRILRPLTDGFDRGIHRAGYSTAASTYLIYNATCVNAITGSINLANVDGGTTRVKNALMQRTSGTDWVGGGGTTEYVTMLSLDASSPTVSLRSKTVTFVGGGDYTPASGDTNAKDAGTDLSADSHLPHSTDLRGATIAGTWDVGALEYIAPGGGGAVIPVLMASHINRYY